MERSALIVAVPEAEPLVEDWRLRYDNASLGIPAHVTLLFPFVAATELEEPLFDELRAFFAAHRSWDFALPRTARFPEIIYLEPSPDEPFRQLTNAIFERYPDFPPYEGIHDTVIPHLTVARGEPALLEEVDAALTPNLPIAAEAREVTLLEENAAGFWRMRERFRLG